MQKIKYMIWSHVKYAKKNIDQLAIEFHASSNAHIFFVENVPLIGFKWR